MADRLDERDALAMNGSPAADRSAADTGRPPGQTPANEAVWLTAKRGGLDIRPAPFTPPEANQIVIRNGAVAINPIDWLLPLIGDFAVPWLKYPFVLGSDVAGEVVAVGSAVSRFRVGERVLGHAVGAEKSRNKPAEGAFQRYTVLLEHMASAIPDTMPYESAAVLPLGLSTASCGLFQKDYLALHYPSADATPTGETLLIWGGSTSVGSNAIQLAVAAGYDVITTASPRNFDYVRTLGATQVFNYASSTVVADLIAAFSDRTLAGALAIGAGSVNACLDIVRACKGKKFIATASPPVPFDKAPAGSRRILWLVPTLARMLAANVSMTIKARMWNVGTRFIWGGSLLHNEVSRVIYGDFLPAALADHRYVAAPDPLIAGHGLGCIPDAMATQKRGVSARKVVVSL